MDVERAIHIIARDLIFVAVDRFVEDGWESYSEIGEGDWLDIVDVARNMVSTPDFAPYDEALDLLEKRAQKFDEDATLAVGDE